MIVTEDCSAQGLTQRSNESRILTTQRVEKSRGAGSEEGGSRRRGKGQGTAASLRSCLLHRALAVLKHSLNHSLEKKRRRRRRQLNEASLLCIFLSHSLPIALDFSLFMYRHWERKKKKNTRGFVGFFFLLFSVHALY